MSQELGYSGSSGSLWDMGWQKKILPSNLRGHLIHMQSINSYHMLQIIDMNFLHMKPVRGLLLARKVDLGKRKETVNNSSMGAEA